MNGGSVGDCVDLPLVLVEQELFFRTQARVEVEAEEVLRVSLFVLPQDFLVSSLRAWWSPARCG
ncbi:hypothetical protein ACIA8M_36835 [Streptomyces anulatus]